MDLTEAMEHVIEEHAQQSGKFYNNSLVNNCVIGFFRQKATQLLSRKLFPMKIFFEILSEEELMIHEGRESTKKMLVTESPVGLIQTENADWSNTQNLIFVKPRNIESSGSDDTNQSQKIMQRLGLRKGNELHFKITIQLGKPSF